ncbi:MAG: glycine/sarcosine/betaine reductase selenoprotein B family protein [Candidatus Binatia bacterium]
MGKLGEFSLPLRVFLKAYRWRRVEPVPWAPLEKPLADCRLALVSSAGFVQRGQPPFDESVQGGDVSFRKIPSNVDVAELVDTHRSEAFDHTGLRRDPNVAFPIDRARELVAAGRIGSVAGMHLSFMGSITAPGRLVRDTAPAAAGWLVADNVDIALLVPV